MPEAGQSLGSYIMKCLSRASKSWADIWAHTVTERSDARSVKEAEGRWRLTGGVGRRTRLRIIFLFEEVRWPGKTTGKGKNWPEKLH